MIKIAIDNCFGVVHGDIPPYALVGINNICSYEVKGAEKSELFKKGRWDGKKRLFSKKDRTFALGLLSKVRSVLDSHNIPYEIEDMREEPQKAQKDILLSGAIHARDYQIEAVERAKEMGRGVLQVATGGGKTVIGGLLISEMNMKTVFLVHTKDLLYQAKGSFEEILDVPIGQIGDGVIDIQDVTVATIQTLGMFLDIKVDDEDSDEKKMDSKKKKAKHKEVTKFMHSIGLMIFDEVHRVACDSAYNVCSAIKNAKYRIGLSASPFRDDGADIMIEASIGEVIYEISATYLIEQGHLVPPIIKFVTIPASINPAFDNRTYEQIYRDEIVNNAYRNEQVLKYASDFMELGIPTLILVQQIKHGNMLKKLISDNYHPIDFISGRDFTEKRLRAIEEMREGQRISLIASTIADEGLDIKRLAGLVIAGGGKSSTRALQRIGRVLRTFEGKTHALIVDFNDQAKFLDVHSQKRKEMYSLEKGFTILEL